MSAQEDFQATLAYLRIAADPLGDAASLFVTVNPETHKVSLEEVQICGQAILASLVSLNMALESLVRITGKL